MIGKVLKTLKVSERRACRVVGQVRTSQRYIPEVRSEEERLTGEILSLATRYGRYGQEQDNSTTQTERLQGEPPESRENLATGRLEGATKTTKAGTALL